MVVAPAAGVAAPVTPTTATNHGYRTPGTLPGVAAQSAEDGLGDPGAAIAALQSRHCGSAFSRSAGAREGAEMNGACPAAALTPAPTCAVALTAAVAVECGTARCAATTGAACRGAGCRAAGAAPHSAAVASGPTATAPAAATE